MNNRLFAIFNTRENVSAAIDDLAGIGISKEQCSLIFHENDLDEFDTHVRETDARGGAIRGFLTGGTAGAITAGLLGGAFFGVGAIAAALAGAAGGGALGALGGGLTGSALPDKSLHDLLQKMDPGKILVTADLNDTETEKTVERIFKDHGAVDVVRQSVA